MLFNSEIVVDKQVNFAAIDVHKVLLKARDESCALVTNEEWKSNNMSKSNNSCRTERSHKRSDIAALLAKKASAAKSKSLFRELTRSKANLALQ